MEKADSYQVRKLNPRKEYLIQVPGSKSITNRAFLLAALSGKKCVLSGVLFSDDTRGFLDCLIQLGFRVEIKEEKQKVTIQGTDGRIPNPEASINVRSAGTAARFLTVALAFAGGNYYLDASEQMRKRPMEPILKILEKLNVKFRFNNKEYHFPFELSSQFTEDEEQKDKIQENKIQEDKIQKDKIQKMETEEDRCRNDVAQEENEMSEITIDTNLSSQFASALLMAACLLPTGLKIHLTGSRTAGSYIKMTLAMMKQFGIQVKQTENCYEIAHQEGWGLAEYEVEPDVSAACYFYAMVPLLKTSVIVKGVQGESLQGDIQFLNVLEQMGCQKEVTSEGIKMTMKDPEMHGVDISMKDFSDQTMTLAAIAPFADSATRIHNIGHIRFQESDRIRAILTELQRMGVCCEEVPEIDGVQIFPWEKVPEDHIVAEGESTIECESATESKSATENESATESKYAAENESATESKNAAESKSAAERESIIERGNITIETYDDHRMAMAFTLPGLKTGNIVIKNPGCCRKTFENYFSVIDSLY